MRQEMQRCKTSRNVFLNVCSPKGFAMSKKLVLKSLAAVALAFPLLVSAESQLNTTGGNAVARLDFRVVIPRVLFLGVGAGAATPLANDTNINEVAFDYTSNPLAVGTGTTGVAGSVTGNVVPVYVFGNNGQITITSTNSGNLVNGATPADTIAFSEITATSNNTSLPVAAASGGTSSPALNGSSKITRQSANWTFAFSNTNEVAAGTYTGRVTYTATMP
jgi:hypothetical protein